MPGRASAGLRNDFDIDVKHTGPNGWMTRISLADRSTPVRYDTDQLSFRGPGCFVVVKFVTVDEVAERMPGAQVADQVLAVAGVSAEPSIATFTALGRRHEAWLLDNDAAHPNLSVPIVLLHDERHWGD